MESEDFPQKLKQSVDIINIIWAHKQSKIENFAQFTSWFLICIFHAAGGLSDTFGGLVPLAHACAAIGHDSDMYACTIISFKTSEKKLSGRN